jgi:hypothetical protein
MNRIRFGANLLIALLSIPGFSFSSIFAQQAPLLRVTTTELLSEISVPFKNQKSTVTPRSGMTFLALTVEPTRDGRFDQRNLKLVGSAGSRYTYAAVDPTLAQNWLVYDLKGTPLASRNIAEHFKYEGKKLTDLVPSTEDGKFNIGTTSEGTVLSGKIENHNPVSWEGDGVKFKILFEVKKSIKKFTLIYKDKEKTPIEIK